VAEESCYLTLLFRRSASEKERGREREREREREEEREREGGRVKGRHGGKEDAWGERSGSGPENWEAGQAQGASKNQ
jgi:hypothetical protein